ncbi:MmgE/PrpD family protein [Porticoccaceae bacterium]|nr:MmgE/PrpD family protein [Porticoccaceae bacterium]
MPPLLIDKICKLVITPRTLSAREQTEIVLAFEDTLAVSHAGWHEPVVQALLPLYRGDRVNLLNGEAALSMEHAAFLHAVAGHALDYDDVHLLSVTHPSVVIVPAILAVVEERPALAGRAMYSYAVGVAVNIALGRVMGFSHYEKGWHATSTIGALAGAAALSYLLGFDEAGTRRALSLSASQAGGLQVNFGTMAKPVQAGQAASAAVRSALMAEARVSAADDVFAQSGFFDLYGGADKSADPNKVPVDIELTSLSRKLYPCCYATHRMIAAALGARGQLPKNRIPDDALIIVTVPYGLMRPLQIVDPRTGMEAKFCAAYIIALALIQGRVGLSDFEDAAVTRPEIRELMTQVELTEEPLQGEVPIGIDHGQVHLTIRMGAQVLASSEIRHYPGSADQPVTDTEMNNKIGDCLARYQLNNKAGPTLEAFRDSVRQMIGLGFER